jgi:hypothetical protein
MNMRFHLPGFDHLVTAYPDQSLNAMRYVRMLMHGPFKAFGDLISLKQHKHRTYIQVDDLGKWPANVLFNFCIASRVPVEYPQLLGRWVELVKAGYPEVLAFLLSYSTDGKPFKVSREFPSRNHFWFDPPAEWTKIMAGTPDLDAPSFKDSPFAMLPTNQIWGKSDVHYRLAEMTDGKVAEYFDIKLAEKPKPRERNTLTGNYIKKQWIDIEAHGLAGQPMQFVNGEVPVGQVQPAGQMAQHWAQIIAQQHQAVNANNAQGLQPNVIQPPQPPQPVNWEIDEDDIHHDFPDFDDDD